MPTVAVVDHRPLTLAGLRLVLRAADFDVVTDPSGDSLPSVLPQRRLDVVMAAAVGEAALAELVAAASARSVPVIALVDDHDSALLRAAVDAGCDGLLVTSATVEELVHTIRTVCDGQQTVHHAALATLMRDHRAVASAPQLGPREQAVLERAARGMTNDQIASDLDIAPSTVKTHLGRVFEKLGARDRAHAVALGFRRRILS